MNVAESVKAEPVTESVHSVARNTKKEVFLISETVAFSNINNFLVIITRREYPYPCRTRKSSS